MDLDIFLVVLSVLLTVGLTIVSLEATYKPPTPKRIFWYRILTAAFAIGLVAVTIIQASKSKYSDDKRDNKIGNLEGISQVMRDMLLHPNPSDTDKQILLAIGQLPRAMPPKVVPVQQVTPPVVAQGEIPITALTNAELRAKAIEWATKMRDFQSAWRTQRDQQEARQIPMSQFAGDQNQEFRRRTNELLQAYKQRDDDFKKVYLGTALALRDELTNRYIRVGAVPPKTPNGYSISAFDGILAGPDPVGEVAAYLEILARELPDK